MVVHLLCEIDSESIDKFREFESFREFCKNRGCEESIFKNRSNAGRIGIVDIYSVLFKFNDNTKKEDIKDELKKYNKLNYINIGFI